MKQLISFSIICLFLIGCKEKVDQSVAIYEQAKTLQNEGKTLEALAVYESLAEYEESESYIKAEAELLKKGISIKSARSSWTIQKQIDLQNKIMRQYNESGTFPEFTTLGDITDAWKMPMTISYRPTEKHLFKMRSFGPDSLEQTADDLVLSVADKDKLKKKNPKKGGEIIVDLNELGKLDQ